MSTPKSVDKADIRPFPTAETVAPLHQPATNEAPANERTQPHAVPDKAVSAKGGAKKGFGKRVVPPSLVAVAAIGALWYGYNWWTVGRFMVSTDDAYVQGDIASIAPKVTGYIENIPVAANQQVKAVAELAWGRCANCIRQGQYFPFSKRNIMKRQALLNRWNLPAIRLHAIFRLRACAQLSTV